ncbi:bleomycin resistance protein [Allopontixanthobacter sp.]|uniref:bleomycin resistance protein n=1 Tax=Allopontixanthobacter sp. TaxID=2906452 RepID=UPI002ABCBF03|nr:bleomycin resistance protein [Allopontixanthobacter sp.]MDZ4307860.1 bleomycin resistance protein [Allopontixanthobacter sp.]
MADRATPNLPSRDFGTTEAFYGALGFECSWRDTGWMILTRGTVQLEFFPYPDLDPAKSSFGCCIRLDDMPAMHRLAVDAGVPQTNTGFPRISDPRRELSGLDIAYLIDPDGTLVRLVQNA